jgi:hypothetical protein
MHPTDPGVVHQDVAAAEVRLDCIDGAPYILVIGQLTSNPQAAAAGRLDLFDGVFAGDAIDNHNVGAIFGQPARIGLPESAGAAGHDRDSSSLFPIFISHIFPCPVSCEARPIFSAPGNARAAIRR